MSEHATHEMHQLSLDCYYEERDAGRLGKRSQAIMAVYKAKGRPLTDRDVMEALGFTDMNSCRPRITELVKCGLLRECGQRRDTVTGKMCRLVVIR